MRIIHLNTSDTDGGAARAAYRIHHALVESGCDSFMRVLRRGTRDERVKAGVPPRSIATHVAKDLASRWRTHSRRDWQTDNPVFHTFGEKSAGLVEELNASDADLLNLHWISSMLSVKDIGRLKKPIVWTLHDMWAFCGGEHYAPDNDEARFRLGYRPDNRPEGETGPDLNRQTWEEKRRFWAHQGFTFVSPSQWLAGLVRESALFNQSPVHVIPNCLDVDNIWRPISREAARNVLGLPQDKKLILFGAAGGTSDPRKGGDLLHEAIDRAASIKSGFFELMIYGQEKPKDSDNWPCPVHWLGIIRDDRVLAQAYSAADLFLLPSRQDNLPNTAVEAQACGTPIAGFNIGGLPEIITHRSTGWLAEAFDASDLAEGMLWLLADDGRYTTISTAARNKAVERFSEPVVAAQYIELYQKVVERAIKTKST